MGIHTGPHSTGEEEQKDQKFYATLANCEFESILGYIRPYRINKTIKQITKVKTNKNLHVRYFYLYINILKLIYVLCEK